MEHAVGGEAAAAQVLVLTGHALGRGPTSSPTFVAGFTSRAPRRVRVCGSVATTTASAASLWRTATMIGIVCTSVAGD